MCTYHTDTILEYPYSFQNHLTSKTPLKLVMSIINKCEMAWMGCSHQLHEAMSLVIAVCQRHQRQIHLKLVSLWVMLNSRNVLPYQFWGSFVSVINEFPQWFSCLTRQRYQTWDCVELAWMSHLNDDFREDSCRCTKLPKMSSHSLSKGY